MNEGKGEENTENKNQTITKESKNTENITEKTETVVLNEKKVEEKKVEIDDHKNIEMENVVITPNNSISKDQEMNGNMDSLDPTETPNATDDEDEEETKQFLGVKKERIQRTKENILKIIKFLIMFSMTFGYFFAELIVGVMGNSLALISDALHMLSDALSLFIGFLAVLASFFRDPKTRERKSIFSSTYGFSRSQVVGGFINGIFLISVVLFIYFEAVGRFLSVEIIENPLLVLIISGVGLAINVIGMLLFGHHHDHGGHSHGEGENIEEDEKLIAKMVKEGDFEGIKGDPKDFKRIFEKNKEKDEDHDHDNDHKDEKEHHKHEHKDHKHKEHHHKHKHKHGHKHSHGHSHNIKLSDCCTNPFKMGLNMFGVFIHIFGDFLGSIAVMICCIFYLIFPPSEVTVIDSFVALNSTALVYSNNTATATHKMCVANCFIPYLDPILSCVIGTLILFSGVPLLINSTRILMQGSPSSVNVKKVEEALLKIKEIIAIHEMHVWQLTENQIVCSMHILCENNTDFMCCAKKIQLVLHSHGIHSSTIQPEFLEKSSSKDKKKLKLCKLGCVRQECSSLTCCPNALHDALEESIKEKVEQKKISNSISSKDKV